MKIQIPHNGWRPRDYQKDDWKGLLTHNHAEIIAHRRYGKDELCLHATAVKAMERPATYWHMLPQGNQVRRAIWEAVNPHTGRRRIDEAFPHELRTATRENDMMIKFVNGSTWQALGSDNYEGSIGSPPAGCVFSEWPQAKPAARAFLRPIFLENNGFQWYIGTPRGKNHGHKTFRWAQKTAGVYASLKTVRDTDVFTDEQLKQELDALIDEWGVDMGTALYEQEYECSFDAAILGAFYGAEIRNAEAEGRFTYIAHEPSSKVYCAMDIGWTDDTAIWWFQVVSGEIRIIDYYCEAGRDPDEIASQLLGRRVRINLINSEIRVEIGDVIPEIEHRSAYDYSDHGIGLPHDARAKTQQAKGKSLMEQFAKVFGMESLRIVPSLSKQDGIQAGRQLLKRCYVSVVCEDGWEALKAYRREWNDGKSAFNDNPVHDWTSHPADAFRYMAIMWAEKAIPEKPKESPKGLKDITLDELWKKQRPARRGRI